MPCITKSKQNLQAQAALAQSSKNSSTSRNITRPSTPSQPLCPPTPAVSPTPPDTPNILSDEESNDVQETFQNEYLHLPDLSPKSPEEEDGYHTDDDLLELVLPRLKPPCFEKSNHCGKKISKIFEKN